MKPVSMPTVSFRTLATGARQFVVHEPLETTRCSLVSVSWLTPNTMVASAPSAGAETSTRLAPAVRCAEALSLAVKMPVHSSAMSTPSAFQGSFDGSRSAETLILPLPRLIESPSTVTVPGKRPCTESKRSRCALVSTGPRSLMPTTSISLRPASAMARSTLRPIRPNPLIPTRMDIPELLWRGAPAVLTLIYSWRPAMTNPEMEKWNRRSPFSKLGQRCFRNFFRRDPEMLEQVLGGRARAEGGHADEFAVGSDDGVPSLADRGLDADPDLGIADDGAPGRGRRGEKELEAGDRDDARRDAALGQQLARLDRERDFGSGGKQRDLGLALGRQKLVGAGR